MSPALDTGEPQGSPPTSPSEKSGSGGGGAGVDLDLLCQAANETLAEQAGLNRADILVSDSMSVSARSVLALVERVRVLEAVAEAADRYVNWDDPRIVPTAEIRNRWAAQDALRAALAAAGGGPDER